MFTNASFALTSFKPDNTVFYFPKGENRPFHLLATGVRDVFQMKCMSSADWPKLDLWLNENSGWKFGWISYDAKNSVEELHSNNVDTSTFPQINFIIPENVVEWNEVNSFIHMGEWREEFRLFSESSLEDNSWRIHLQPRVSKPDYLKAVNKMQEHIHQGDIYEVNYCQEFFALAEVENPFALWKKLHSITEAPHACYVQHDDLHVMCASPERFLMRVGEKLISQPIKGTVRRGVDAKEEMLLKEKLQQSEKERSENIMIVDLVRNDLAKSAKRGTVKVEELVGLHTFKTVHHLISTVSAEINENVSFSQLVRDTFPMGSMTGAPKIRAMQLIEDYEFSSRGLYSGTVGYIRPDGDFDFNVVIRSLIYNRKNSYLSCTVGGAITSLSDPESEYEECLLKAQAIIKTLK